MSSASEADSYSPIEGSERDLPPSATLLGDADSGETMSVTIFLRRRPDGQPLPDFSYYETTPPTARRRLSDEEFAARHGASDDDVEKVAEFARSHGLTVVDSNAARRSVIVRGTVAQMSEAFHVQLRRYRHSVKARSYEAPQTEEFRGREGAVYVPDALHGIIEGVFGLDDRRITKSAAGDPPNTATMAIPTIRQLYNFPANSSAGRTIAIFSERGYLKQDVTNYFATLPQGYPAPTITEINVDASNNGFGDLETTQDICIAGTAAPGAAIAVYFTSYTQQGWVDLLFRLAHPEPGEPRCSVLSSSFYVSDGDDSASLSKEGISTSWLSTVDTGLQHCAFQGITVCIASGDQGTDCKRADGKAHVTFPASDPFVLAVGGTSVGNIVQTASTQSFTEYVWNDTFNVPGFSTTGATGGGISDTFGLPPYQSAAGVPKSVNDGHVGRGVPDVAANASPNSGYPLNLAQAAAQSLQNPTPMSGTSSSAPLWAGLIAVLDSALGADLGFVNPTLYAVAPKGFRGIVGPPGPSSNAFNGAPGYPAGGGWNACTGLGSPDGTALLQAIETYIAEQEKRALALECAQWIPNLEEVLRNRGPKFTTAQFAEARASIHSCSLAGYLDPSQVAEAERLLAEIEASQQSGKVPHPAV